jgi:hypothetical protein
MQDAFANHGDDSRFVVYDSDMADRGGSVSLHWASSPAPATTTPAT